MRAKATWVCLLVAATAYSCGSDDGGDSGGGGGSGASSQLGSDPLGLFDATKPRVCVDDWCWENPYPHGETNRAVWVAGPDEAWIIGDGPAMRSQGTGFVGVDVPDIGEQLAVWGSGAEVWIAGSEGTAHYDGASWTAEAGVTGSSLHGSGPNDVWLAGGAGVWRWDGSTWSPDATAPGGNLVWVEAPGTVWLLSATAQRLEGGSWQPVAWNATGTAVDVFGLGGELWVVTVDDLADPSAGELQHFDGNAFETMALPLANNEAPTSVWAASAGQLWLTTTRDVWTYAGGSWTAGPWPAIDGWTDHLHVPAALGALLAVSGSSASDVWAVGAQGQILRYDGNLWRHADTQVPIGGELITWLDASGLWLGYGDQIFPVTGSEIVPIEVESNDTFPKLVDLWGDGHGSLWGVGDNGLIVRVRNGSAELIPSNVTNDLMVAWGSGSADVWVGGMRDVLLHWDGVAFTQVVDYENGESDIWDIEGSGPNDVWVMPYDYYGEVQHYDGSSWTSHGNGLYNYAISAQPSGCLWRVSGSEVWRAPACEGDCWTMVASSFGVTMTDVHALSCDEAFAIGELGVIWHYDGGTETGFYPGQLTSRSLTRLVEVDGTLFALGDDAVILSRRP